MRIVVGVCLGLLVVGGSARASDVFGPRVFTTFLRPVPTESPLARRGCVVFQQEPRPGRGTLAFRRACPVGRPELEKSRMEIGTYDPTTGRLMTLRSPDLDGRPEWVKPDDQLAFEWVDGGKVLIVGARRFDPAPRLGELYVRRRAYRSDDLRPLVTLPLPFDVVEVGRRTVTVAIFGTLGPGLSQARTWPELEAQLGYTPKPEGEATVRLSATTHPDWAQVVVRREPPHAIVSVVPNSGM